VLNGDIGLLVAALDTSVVAAGIGWSGGPARRLFVLLARRAFLSVRTQDLTAEWADTLQDLAQYEPRWQNPNWVQWFDWLRQKSSLVEPGPLRTTVKRDPDHDVVLAAALGGRATCLVSYDRDLLDLGKPFGIEILTPEAFVSRLLRGQ
jgi:putative PIN family toxin of toxin-antitoxin system